MKKTILIILAIIAILFIGGFVSWPPKWWPWEKFREITKDRIEVSKEIRAISCDVAFKPDTKATYDADAQAIRIISGGTTAACWLPEGKYRVSAKCYAWQAADERNAIVVESGGNIIVPSKQTLSVHADCDPDRKISDPIFEPVN